MISQTQTDKKHITFIGRKKVGKSKLANAFIGHDSGIVTTFTDKSSEPIKQSSRLLPYGLEVFIDAIDIEELYSGGYGSLDSEFHVLKESDFIIVVLEGKSTLTLEEIELLMYLKKNSIPYLAAVNKIENGVNEDLLEELSSFKSMHFEISCTEKVGIDSLKLKLIRMLP